MSEEFEKKSGVHVEVMPVTDGDSPYTKVVSLYNSGNPPTMSILDTTDVIALAEAKAAEHASEVMAQTRKSCDALRAQAEARLADAAESIVRRVVKTNVHC